ncbi:hypothetical protein AB9K41_22860, partial [Cribrihabitans sp. XS_ASV171]
MAIKTVPACETKPLTRIEATTLSVVVRVNESWGPARFPVVRSRNNLLAMVVFPFGQALVPVAKLPQSRRFSEIFHFAGLGAGSIHG